MYTKISLILLVALIEGVVSSSDDVILDWCKPVDWYDSYSQAARLIGSEEIKKSDVDWLIERTLQRIACDHQLKNESLNCSQCLTSDNIYHALRLADSDVITPPLYNSMSLIMATFLSNLPRWCLESQTLDWSNVTVGFFLHELLEIESVYPDHHPEGHEDEGHGHSFSLGQLESLMRHIAQSYIPGADPVLSSENRESTVQYICDFQPIRSFSSREVSFLSNTTHPLEGVDEEWMDEMSAILVTRLAYGECITRVEQDTAVSHDFITQLFQSYSDEDSCVISHQGGVKQQKAFSLERLGEALGVDEFSHEHEHEHASVLDNKKVLHHVTDDESLSRKKRATDDHEHGETTDVNNTCVRLNELLTSFNLDPDHPSLSKSDLIRLCPALIQQSSQGCPNSLLHDNKHSTATAAEAYGYGTVAVLVISGCCYIGLIIVQWRHTKAYRYIMSVMLGLGVGSLVGDALLHLIPHGLGLHDHSEEDHSHGHEEGSGLVIEPFVWKMLCACAGIWFYYNLQLGLYLMGKHVEKKTRICDQASISTHDNLAFNGSTHKDSTSSVHFSHDHNNCELKSTKSLEYITEQGESKALSHPNGNISINTDRTADVSDIHHTHGSVAWMVTIGDAIHNFADGLAIGAAFSESWRVGLSTSIAILCHELPHEFGDVAVMLSTGWSVRRVAICQTLSQMTGFIGLYIGIAVSDNSTDAQQWIFSITCGFFLYVALANIIPELVEYFSVYKPQMIFLTSNVGMLLGFGAMLVIAIFEEEININ